MTGNGKSSACCGGAGADKPQSSEMDAACCSPSPEVASQCCEPRVDQHPAQPAMTPSEGEKRLDIDFLYLDLSVCGRCQDTASVLDGAIAEVTQVLAATGVEVALNKIHVASEEQAATLGFLVSPTIRLNGRDIQMNFRESPCGSCGSLCDCPGGVSCREWEYQGHWHTAPPKGLIVEAILKTVYGGDAEDRDEPREKTVTPENLKRFYSSLRARNENDVIP